MRTIKLVFTVRNVEQRATRGVSAIVHDYAA
nr:MAG TPA: hypothetical protein [Caudoviricetes sp.]